MSILTWFQKWQAYGVVTVSSRSKLSRGEFTRVASNLYSKMNFGKQYLQNHYPWRISQMNLFIDSRVLHLLSLLFCFIAMISFVCHFFEHITVGLVTVFFIFLSLHIFTLNFFSSFRWLHKTWNGVYKKNLGIYSSIKSVLFHSVTYSTYTKIHLAKNLWLSNH